MLPVVIVMRIGIKRYTIPTNGILYAFLTPHIVLGNLQALPSIVMRRHKNYKQKVSFEP